MLRTKRCKGNYIGRYGTGAAIGLGAWRDDTMNNIILGWGIGGTT